MQYLTRIWSKVLNRHADAPTNVSAVDDDSLDERYATAKLTFAALGTLDNEGRKLRWSLSLSFRIQEDGSRRLRIRGYALDGEEAPALALRLSGASDDFEVAADQNRRDVLRALKIAPERHDQLALCGFAADVRVLDDVLNIQILLEGRRIDLGEAKLESQVLFGHEGWLFLAGDRNDSPEQFSRDFVPDRGWRDGWTSYFAAYQALTSTPGLKSRSFVIAPSKEELFPELYPLPPARHRLIHELLDRFSDESGLVWPLEILRPQRELSFDRSETHWTDFGARLVCEELMRNWGLKLPDLPQLFSLAAARGDLGDKVTPRLMTHRPAAQWQNGSKLIFDNFVLHHGNILVWSNPKPHIDETLMIFGGSSSAHMIRYFSAVFARVVFVYSAGSWDADLLALERPSRLILQTSQRFLKVPPQPEVKAREVALQKIEKKQITCRKDHAEAMAAWTDPSVAALLG